MGNEQQGGMNDNFPMNTSNDQSNQQENQSPPWTNHRRVSITKPSWEIARDISMDILSRKSTRLSLKPGPLFNPPSPRPIRKKHVLPRASIVPEPFQIYRIPRMPTEKEAAQIAISYELSCSFCESSCVSNYIRCRICTKTFHSQCLFQRGHIIDQSFSLPRLAKQDWSCPECSDLTRLLNQDEIHNLINAFEQIDRDKDGYIVLEEFLSFQSNKNISDGLELFVQCNHEIGRKIFSSMDSKQQGVVAWSDFSLFYSCKLIAVKDKRELTTKLTDKELVLARKLFFNDPRKTFDNQYNITITREYFNRISKDLILLLKKKYGSEFFDTIFDDDHHIEDTFGKLPVMHWSEFLGEISLLILFNRLNDDIICSQSRRAAIPAHLSNASVVPRSTLPPIQVDSPSGLTFSRSNTPTGFMPCDESFRKHAKILQKLNRQEEFKRKQMDSLANFTIVENIDEENHINLPKLKLNTRDDRRTITDPWTSVKQIEQLRNQPILIKTTRINLCDRCH